jgi:NAD(P)H dehydrogenase (quinone)
MKKALIIYAHPNPKSLNHAILETVQQSLAQKRAETRLHDLYAMNFNPVLAGAELANRGAVAPDVAAIQSDITWADTLVFIYPVWWMDRPAILKGWFDRCFTHGFAFTMQGGYRGLLGGRKAIILQTAGGGADAYGAQGESLLHNTIGMGTLGFAGITDITAKTFYNVVSETDENRKKMLAEVSSLIQ